MIKRNNCTSTERRGFGLLKPFEKSEKIRKNLPVGGGGGGGRVASIPFTSVQVIYFNFFFA